MTKQFPGNGIAFMQVSPYAEPMSLADLVRETRIAHGWNKTDLAKQAVVSLSTISRVERGLSPGNQENAARIRSALGIDSATWDAASRGVQPPPSMTPAARRTPLDAARELAAMLSDAPERVPEVTIYAAAGEGNPVDEGVEYWPYQRTPEQKGHWIVAVPVRGDCMEPEYRQGHRVFVDRDASPRPGNVVVAIYDGEVVLRRLIEKDGSQWLVANKRHRPVKLNGDTSIVGVVTGGAYRAT